MHIPVRSNRRRGKNHEDWIDMRGRIYHGGGQNRCWNETENDRRHT